MRAHNVNVRLHNTNIPNNNEEGDGNNIIIKYLNDRKEMKVVAHLWGDPPTSVLLISQDPVPPLCFNVSLKSAPPPRHLSYWDQCTTKA